MAKGVYIRTEKHININRISHIGQFVSNDTKKLLSKVRRGNSNGFKKGNIPWNKGLTKEENIIIQNNALRHSQKMSGRKLTKEHIKKCLKRNPKSSLEIKFENIINKIKLPYKFVGNGKFLIGRKCPDFINVNGQKIAVEVYYRKHKELLRNKTIEQWQQERQKIFDEYDWQIEFFNEFQVNEQEIKRRLGG